MTDLKKMSNEDLLYHFRMKYEMHTNGELSGDTKAIKAELLNRLNGSLVCERCGVIITNFEEGDIHGCIGHGTLRYFNPEIIKEKEKP